MSNFIPLPPEVMKMKEAIARLSALYLNYYRPDTSYGVKILEQEKYMLTFMTQEQLTEVESGIMRVILEPDR